MNPNRFKATYLGDEVWFVLNESYRSTVPPGAIVYTLAEAAILAERSESTRKIAHEAKKAVGAKVSGRLLRANLFEAGLFNPPPPSGTFEAHVPLGFVVSR